MEFISDLRLNQEEIKNNIAEFTIYVGNMSYIEAMHLPITEINRLAKIYNKKIKRENKQYQ